MKISDFMIAEQRNELLDGLGHEAVGLTLAVERRLQAIGAPGVSWRMETIEPGLLRALLGKRRDCLLIENSSACLREYMVLISARRLGTALHITWTLAAAPRIGNDIRRATRFGTDGESRYEIGAELDVLDWLELDGFIRVTRLALKKAVAELRDDEDTGADEVEGVSGLA
ncbi:hypothetical protein HY374_02605 [Candidatus Berkelbacteria bacterium]|nr:hypothetical protein [Candidatus Berkelbacteria bacterium]